VVATAVISQLTRKWLWKIKGVEFLLFWARLLLICRDLFKGRFPLTALLDAADNRGKRSDPAVTDRGIKCEHEK
jgi:hypothetical protein